MSGPTATVEIESPLGPVSLTADDDHLLKLRIGTRSALSRPDHPILREASAQLLAWFSGELEDFALPLLPLDTEEGVSLRAGIAAIPYGETRTYGEVAKRTGSIARAVGQACKTNTLPIIIPCHRVVSTSGPEYYSGGDGPRTKGWLLDFESANLPPDRRTRLL